MLKVTKAQQTQALRDMQVLKEDKVLKVTEDLKVIKVILVPMVFLRVKLLFGRRMCLTNKLYLLMLVHLQLQTLYMV